jgi:hypothetical protein
MGGVVSAIGNAVGGVVSGVGSAVSSVGSLLSGGGGGGGSSGSSSTTTSAGNTTNSSTTNNNYNYDSNEGLKATANATMQVADMQKKSADEYLAFQKQQYAELKPLADKLSQAQLDTMAQQSDIAAKNEARAQEYSDYEKNTYRPLEKSIVEEANNYDTKAKQDEMARQGIADVATAYDAQRKQALDTLSQYGINPNSNRFAAINSQLSRGEAADKAGVATNARTNAEQLGYARKLDAASLGRNLASNASTAYGVSLNASNSANASGNNALATAGSPGATMSSGYGAYSGMLGNSANSYYGAGSTFGKQYAADSQLQAAKYGGIGSAAGQFLGSNMGQSALSSLGGMASSALSGAGGWLASAGSSLMSMLADGGEAAPRKRGAIRGPGGPVDDKIPAMLSNGEYVLPADTVKAIGVKKLDKLIKQTHTPAAVQRRQAISARG